MRLAIDQHLVMDMRAGSAAGAAEETDLGTAGDALPDRDDVSVQMAITRRNAIAVIDFDDLAVIVAIAGIGHHAGSGRIDRRHVGRPEIFAGMEGAAAVHRIAADPERAADLVAFKRRRDRQDLGQGAQRREFLRGQGIRVLAAGRHERAAHPAIHPQLGEKSGDVYPG